MAEDPGMTFRHELFLLLEERTLSDFERRKRRLQRLPPEVIGEAIRKAWKREPLTEQEYIAVNLGFLPGEKILH